MSAEPTRSSAAEGGVAAEAEPPLERLRSLLLEEGGLMSGLVLTDDLAGGPVRGPAQVVARGPRAEGARAEYELLVETIYEGYLLHYNAPRVMRAHEADLGLLAGDRLYALGLARLVRLGDIEGVAELADVITLCALAHGAGAPELAAEVWMAGARAVGWGASPEHEQAKALVRAGSPDALQALHALPKVEA
ncbi:MAG TPA: hypothetical protein VGP18_09090 [Solirubrobacteraceae bacterium]|jgi:hypothetical protein|nr:hypothetical protein [Solirubrobacteraceae bacterium]